MGKMYALLRKKIGEMYNDAQILFWYDPTSFFLPFVKSIQEKDIKIFIWANSWFKLKLDLESIFKDELTCRVLVYIPVERSTLLKLNPLTEIEKTSGVIDFSKELLIKEALEGQFDENRINGLIDDKSITIDDIDHLASLKKPEINPKLHLIFKETDPVKIIFTFLIDPKNDEKLNDRDGSENLIAIMSSYFGIDIINVDDPKKIREKFITNLLLIDFKQRYEDDENNLSFLQSISIEKISPEIKKYQKILFELLQNGLGVSFYIEWVQEIEKRINIKEYSYNLEKLLDISTLEWSEYYLLAHLAEIKKILTESRILEYLERKRTDFWSQHNPKIHLFWSIANSLVKLDLKIEEIVGDLKTKTYDFDSFVSQYGNLSLTNSWFSVDTQFRQLEKHVIDCFDDIPFQKYLESCRNHYYELTDQLTGHIANLIQHYPGKNTIKQEDIFTKFIIPKLDAGPIAVFFIDALRYEMGVELMKAITEPGVTKVSLALASLPSLTEFGMNLILPFAKENFSIIEENDKQIPSLAGRKIQSPKDRISWIKDKLQKDVVDLTLDEVLIDKAKIKEKLGKNDLIIVRSDEIDLLGENGKDYQIRSNLNNLILLIKRSIDVLSKIGIMHYVISSDHGFQYTETFSEAMRIDIPQGTALNTHRRVWIGHDGKETAFTVKINSKNLGYSFDFDFIFPRNRGVFKKTSSYVHGGISLQEIIIPVIEIALSVPKDKEKVEKYNISFQGVKITNRYFIVELSYSISRKGLDKYSPDIHTRKIICKMIINNEIITAVTANRGYNPETQEILLSANESNYATFLIPEKYQNGKLKIQLFDPPTEIPLTEPKEIEYELMM